MNGFSNILLGLSLLAIVVLWRRMTSRVRRNSNPSADLQSERHSAQTATEVVSQRMQQMELRLHDFSREVDGHAATRLAHLEKLIQDADRRIGQMDEMMQQCEQSISKLPTDDRHISRTHTLQEKQMMLHLLQAGYQPKQVAQLTGCSLAEVEKIQQQRTAA